MSIVGDDEVRAFQRWLPDHLMPSEFSHNFLFRRDEDGEYEHDFVRYYWEGWIARAISSGDRNSKTEI